MGTAMKESSQIQLVETTVPVIPARVVVAMAEIAEVCGRGGWFWPWVLACSHSMASHSAAICAVIGSGRPRKGADHP